MKRSATLFLPLLLMLASCGTTARFAEQRFQDGVYARPGEETQAVRLYTEDDFAAMAADNISRKHSRDTMVLIVDDSWAFWSGLGFTSNYWNRWRYNWYDPFYYDPFYYGYGYGWYRYYGYAGGWYDPWWYDPYYYGYGYGYGWYDHRYGWYDHPWHYGGYWGHGGQFYTSDRQYVQRSLTQSGGNRESRPGSGYNYRYGTPNGLGSAVINSRSSSSASSGRSQSSVIRSNGGTSSGSVTVPRGEGYNRTRSYTNKNSGGSSVRSSSGSSSSSSRGYSGTGSSTGSSTRSYSGGSSSSSGSSTRSYSGGSSSSSSSGSSRSSGGGGGYSGGGYGGGGR